MSAYTVFLTAALLIITAFCDLILQCLFFFLTIWEHEGEILY